MELLHKTEVVRVGTLEDKPFMVASSVSGEVVRSCKVVNLSKFCAKGAIDPCYVSYATASLSPNRRGDVLNRLFVNLGGEPINSDWWHKSDGFLGVCSSFKINLCFAIGACGEEELAKMEPFAQFARDFWGINPRFLAHLIYENAPPLDDHVG